MTSKAFNRALARALRAPVSRVVPATRSDKKFWREHFQDHVPRSARKGKKR